MNKFILISLCLLTACTATQTPVIEPTPTQIVPTNSPAVIPTSTSEPILPTAAFASTANQIRTAPLWALRTRSRLMHDGLTFTLQEAILRHGGQAAIVTARYNGLTPAQKEDLYAFLNSL